MGAWFESEDCICIVAEEPLVGLDHQHEYMHVVMTILIHIPY